MKSVRTGAVGKVEVVEIERPVPGPGDALVRIRACGICGTDVTFINMGGIPAMAANPVARAAAASPDQLVAVVLGHEPAGEVVAVGADVTGLAVGDHVVVNPQDAPSGIIGCGGEWGAMTEYLLIENAQHADRFGQLISHRIPFTDIEHAFDLTLTPGAAEKVVVTFD